MLENTAEEMQRRIDAYFAQCQGELLLDGMGLPQLDRRGQPVMVGGGPPTVAGLAAHLGFPSRQALLECPDEAVRQARLAVEAYTEGRLFDREGCSGAKFSLINNFPGWSEKKEGKKAEKDRVTVSIALEDAGWK